jgi:hypothetical protein
MRIHENTWESRLSEENYVFLCIWVRSSVQNKLLVIHENTWEYMRVQAIRRRLCILMCLSQKFSSRQAAGNTWEYMRIHNDTWESRLSEENYVFLCIHVGNLIEEISLVIHEYPN